MSHNQDLYESNSSYAAEVPVFAEGCDKFLLRPLVPIATIFEKPGPAIS